MSRRLMLCLSAGALLPLSAACGPMPGWYEDHPPPSHQRPVTTPQRQPAEGGAHAQTPPATHAQPQHGSRIRVIETGRKGTYYLIDEARRMCFFHNAGAVTTIDCQQLPEARHLGSQPTTSPPAPAGTPAPTHRPEPAQPPSTARGGSKDGHVAGANMAPTKQERRRFVQAYTDIFCDRKSGGDADPGQLIGRQGLTVERYSEIEAFMARDDREWRALTQAAVNSCK